MVNALIGWFDALVIAARIADESIPPDRNAATGTSACMWRAVVSRSIDCICSLHWSAHVAKAEKVVHRALVNIEAMAGQEAQRLELRCKAEAPVLFGDIKRLDA